MNLPFLSLYSLWISLIALTYLILSLKKMITNSDSVDSLENFKKKPPIDKLRSYSEAIAKSKFNIRILKILKGANELKIFFVNQGENLYNLKCQGVSPNKVFLELESADLKLDINEPGVILIKDIVGEVPDVELIFEYMTDQKVNKMKRVSINTVTKEISYL
jgi:hypothetical protein